MGENDRTTWDDGKSERNFRERAIDFADLEPAFDGRFAILRQDRRKDYGERRFNMLVELEGVLLNVTITPRDGKLRIISARLANREERELYRARRRNR